VAADWHAYISQRLPGSAMWYTPITGSWGDMRLSAEAPGANRPVALIRRLRLLAAAAEVPYLSPHKYRHGHAVHALKQARDMADYKAISQNLMHDDISVTDGIYAPLVGDDLKRRIAGLSEGGALAPHAPWQRQMPSPDDELKAALEVIARRLAR
jgi:integrase